MASQHDIDIAERFMERIQACDLTHQQGALLIGTIRLSQRGQRTIDTLINDFIEQMRGVEFTPEQGDRIVGFIQSRIRF